MILSDDEKAEALQAIMALVLSDDFDVTHIGLDICNREIASDRPGSKKFIDTGVRIVSIIGNVPLEDDSYGPEVSHDADEETLEFVDEDATDL